MIVAFVETCVTFRDHRFTQVLRSCFETSSIHVNLSFFAIEDDSVSIRVIHWQAVRVDELQSVLRVLVLRRNHFDRSGSIYLKRPLRDIEMVRALVGDAIIVVLLVISLIREMIVNTTQT